MGGRRGRNIQKGTIDLELSKINLAKEELELTQRQIAFAEAESAKLMDVLGLSPVQRHTLDQRTRGNPVMKLKILLSVYRRVEPLAEKQNEGKLQITGKEDNEI